MANTLNRMEAFWFPLCPSNLLNQKTALAYTVLGRHLVVWASANGTIGALEDRCSHRSARLSQGEIHSDGLLSCPYHGWRFDPSGQCRARPQCPDQTISPSCRVTSYAASVRYGYVWVKLDCSSQMCIPDFPESDDTQIRQIEGFHEVWNCSAYRLIENGLDNYHHFFVHAGLLETVTPIPTPIDSGIEESDDGFCYSTVLKLKNSKKLCGALGHGNTFVTVKRTVRWLAPFGISLELDWSHGLWQRIVQYSIPIDHKSCVMNRFYFRNDCEEDVGVSQLLEFERTLIDQDRHIIESINTDDKPLDGNSDNLIEADLPIALFRRRLKGLLAATRNWH